jgi:hypothetical protein
VRVRVCVHARLCMHACVRVRVHACVLAGWTVECVNMSYSRKDLDNLHHMNASVEWGLFYKALVWSRS